MPKPIHEVTLGELLTSSDREVRRHATGCLKALEKDLQRLVAEQDKALKTHNLIIDSYDDAMAHCTGCEWYYAFTGYQEAHEIQKVWLSSHRIASS